jgi:hypothetical protein
MIEGWQERRWSYGKTKFFNVSLTAPYNISQLKVNVRGILWITSSRNTRTIPKQSFIYDQQGFPVKQFTIEVKR